MYHNLNPVGSMNNTEATIVLSGVGTTALSDGLLMNMYRTYGPILRVRHNGTNSAHVTFAQKIHALKAVKATNGAVINGKTLKVSLQRQFTKTTEPCRGFVAGICRKGDMCKYYHVTDNAAFATPAAPPVAAKVPHKPKIEVLKKPIETHAIPQEIQAIPDNKVCRHFSRGYCSQGEQCQFAHVLGLPNQVVPASTGKVARVCLFFQSGVCTRGDACRYVHTPIAGDTPAQSSTFKTVAQSSNGYNENEAQDELGQKDENRTCLECEKPGVAVWKCAKCDNSLYCDNCNTTVHRARVMAKHERIELPSLPKLPRCGECEKKTANVRCEQCEVLFCASCDASVHQFKSLRKHVRVKLSETTERAQRDAKDPGQEFTSVKKNKEKKEVHVVKSVPQANSDGPVLYVESVPQLEFSSDSSESSESEDEEMMEKKVSPSESNDDKQMAAADSETESDEDFDDVKPPPVSYVTPAPDIKAQAQATRSSTSESKDDFDETVTTAKSFTSHVSVPKMELSSDSSNRSFESIPDPASASNGAVFSDVEDELEDEARCKSAAKPTTGRTFALAAISSESESEGEALPIHIVKQVKKLAQKTRMPSESSDSSKREARSKPEVVKKRATPVSRSVKKGTTSASSSDSSSTNSSHSSEAKTPPAPAPLRVRASATPHKKKTGGISANSSHTLVKKIEAYGKSGEAEDLHLDANLNGFERLLAHDCAERLGLAHESIGSGLERHIIISRHGAKRAAVDSAKVSKSKKSKRRYV
ncbi:unnamed protein product [Peronospora belbahrii]|uniref:Uncharacterized protein n=1 Tax=Peronospora belbahrii TaxID=622444 RepID=A0AAU9KSM6_9STRA|nr:unnamed protein product [Peronospora belbahrii]CAH0520713.1 unnamed protein product [Peronospora belbahrii]